MLGKVLGNRYEILEKVGEGGMAYVYKARCRLLNRIVAVKVLRQEFVDDEEFLEKFKNEAQSAASLTHPNIVNIYDVGEDSGVHYIVMEYVEGRVLKDIIRENGSLDQANALEITKQIAKALSLAHRKNIIHRDIKPHNILVTNEGIVKVVDFGIAKAVTSSTTTTMGNVIGSVHYFSPEQAKGRFVDPRSDLYSLGIVLYEMLSGRVPFKGDTPVNIALQHISEDICFPEDSPVSEDIKKLVYKLTQKNQSERYARADDLIKDIELIQKNVSPDFAGVDYNSCKTQKLENLGAELDKIQSAKKAEKPAEIKEVKEEESAMAKKPKIKHKKLLTTLAVILALIASIGATAGGFYIKDLMKPAQMSMPSLENMSVDEARKALEDMGLKLAIEKEIFSSDVSKDHIISQNPDAGTQVKKNYEVKVVVSKGGKLVSVPDFTGENIDSIDPMLSSKKFKEGIVNPVFSEEPEGTIISQSPSPYAKAEEGSEIDFVISKGKESVIVTVPNLIGNTISEARAKLSGITISGIDYIEDPDKEDGIIMKQSPAAGEKVESGSSINIVVNKISGDSKSQGSGGSSSEALVKKQLSIKLPEDRDSIKVTVKDSSGVVYDKTVNPKDLGGVLNVPIEGKRGTSKDYQIFVDGTSYYSGKVNF
ncbi:serine/threonine-protein kinase Sps1 [Peptoclostridium acidaminophilum DSM 3953]|uniref:non-specific serine/threonine protein kinase n=1 Tax=Peptoclostridium acidaminophilum DSM 3953 TaxID=1286171 RepID=W8TKP7_PEPAC|nr:Stk1 family PASTA domain-containing Ser/Thr kinase [Peptoclostridium acidaminophilum]AHM56762.1 serine/threonine-protein kinase Sps1 [Peptoclostridium acidaminophilum DSM 3953]